MIHYHDGDVFADIAPEDRVCVAHVTNNVGHWGGGFTSCLTGSRRIAFDLYQRMPKLLGMVHFTDDIAGSHTFIANMCAQDNTRKSFRRINYAALGHCLEALGLIAEECEIRMPKIGTGIAGGDWELIEEQINFYIPRRDVHVYVL